MGAFGSGKGDFFPLKIFLRAMRSIPVIKEEKENGISNFSDNSINRLQGLCSVGARYEVMFAEPVVNANVHALIPRLILQNTHGKTFAVRLKSAKMQKFPPSNVLSYMVVLCLLFE